MQCYSISEIKRVIFSIVLQLLLVEPPTVFNPTAPPHRWTLFITLAPSCPVPCIALASLSTLREHALATEPLVSIKNCLHCSSIT